MIIPAVTDYKTKKEREERSTKEKTTTFKSCLKKASEERLEAKEHVITYEASTYTKEALPIMYTYRTRDYREHAK